MLTYTDLSIALSIITVAFLLYYFVGYSGSLKEVFSSKFGNEKGQMLSVLFHRLLGTLLYVILPLSIIIFFNQSSLSDFGLGSKNWLESLFWMAILIPDVILVNWYIAKTSDNLATYPQIRIAQWSNNILIISALSWITYLSAYEFMFRGYLFFTCIRVMGVLPSIAINACMYSLLHVHKGAKEALGAIPMGIVLCYVTLQTQTIWSAVVIHCSLALSNEWLSLKFHPNIGRYRK